MAWPDGHAAVALSHDCLVVDVLFGLPKGGNGTLFP